MPQHSNDVSSEDIADLSDMRDAEMETAIRLRSVRMTDLELDEAVGRSASLQGGAVASREVRVELYVHTRINEVMAFRQRCAAL